MFKFFQTLLRPDQEDANPESAEIAQAANILQIGEFQLLQLAYKDWHGKELPEALTDRLFADYMLRKQVPHWARHYARRILDWDKRGLLNAGDSTYHRYDRGYSMQAPGGVRRFVIASVVLLVFVGGSLWVSHIATGGKSTSILPPYFDAKELRTPPKPDGVGPGS
ncbi:MAG: hypothetical protein GKS00_04715 [Alphaproteobacteria bacterium]|nr:hypothetical protein [Alphaproteobacteria bacterium]